MKDPIAEIQSMFEQSFEASNAPQEGDTVELVDETDPDCQAVVFKRKDGTPFMWMPLEAYKHFRDKGTSAKE